MAGPPEATGAGSENAAPSTPGQPAALRQGGTVGAAGARDAGGSRSCSVNFLERGTIMCHIHPTFSLSFVFVFFRLIFITK